MKNIQNLFKENKIVFIYIAFAAVLELSASFFVGARPFFTKFWIPLLLMLVLLLGLMAIKRQKAKRIVALIFLIIQVVTVIASGYLYASNGSAFQKEMLYQRNDAFGTIEQFNLSIWLIVLCIASLVGFCFVMRHFKKKAAAAKVNATQPAPATARASKTLRLCCLALCLVCASVFSITPILNGTAEKKQPNYYYKLDSTGDGNQKYGITSNIVYELLRFSGSAGINLDDIDTIDEFLFSAPSPTSEYHGISEGNNFLYILAESFDTHVLERYTKEENEKIFPNIMRMLDGGIYFSNFRQKEKTDVSEVMSLLGSYPTEKYVHYSYHENSYPYSLPNLFAAKVAESGNEKPQMLSFHQNQASFYNRDDFHSNIGFDDFIAIDDMKQYGMRNDWDLTARITKGERSLDSMTVQTMKDMMMPADSQFFSYWITFTMHGFYEERDNLAECGYYDRLDQHGLFPKGTKSENYWRTYAAAVMDFDIALGEILDDLQQKDILDTTTIVIMPDHNTYYNSLTEYAKNLTNKLDTEGFRLPLIVYDQKLAAALDKKQAGVPADGGVDAIGAADEKHTGIPANADKTLGSPRVIDKFITGADIMPTICDLFGIPLWDNMFAGSTALEDTRQSIAYSRIYNFYFDDRVAFYTQNYLDFAIDDFSDKDFEEFLQRAKVLLDKAYYMDKVYYSDYFADHPYLAPLPIQPYQP